jgi:hypothetical protein
MCTICDSLITTIKQKLTRLHTAATVLLYSLQKKKKEKEKGKENEEEEDGGGEICI